MKIFCLVDYGPPPRANMGFPEMYGMNYGPDGDYSSAPWRSPYDTPGHPPLP
jgi:hypothetical protein